MPNHVEARCGRAPHRRAAAGSPTRRVLSPGAGAGARQSRDPLQPRQRPQRTGQVRRGGRRVPPRAGAEAGFHRGARLSRRRAIAVGPARRGGIVLRAGIGARSGQRAGRSSPCAPRNCRSSTATKPRSKAGASPIRSALSSLCADVERRGARRRWPPRSGPTSHSICRIRDRRPRSASKYGALVCRLIAERYPQPHLCRRRRDRAKKCGSASSAAFQPPFRTGRFRSKAGLASSTGAISSVRLPHRRLHQDDETDIAASLCDRFVPGPLPGRAGARRSSPTGRMS